MSERLLGASLALILAGCGSSSEPTTADAAVAAIDGAVTVVDAPLAADAATVVPDAPIVFAAPPPMLDAALPDAPPPDAPPPDAPPPDAPPPDGGVINGPATLEVASTSGTR